MRVRWIYLGGATITAGVLAGGTAAGFTAQDWAVSADVSLIYMGVLAAAWAALYGFRSAWYRSHIGRAVLAQSVILAAVICQGAVSQWVSHEYPGRHQIRFALYSLGAIAFVSMLISLWREQQRGTGEVTPRDPPP